MEAHIFKILRRDEWKLLHAAGFYDGSADDVRDGFIHLSTAEQVPGTLARHFTADAGEGESDLQLLWIDGHALGTVLRWEASRGGVLFPHLYSALSMEHVMQTVALDVEPAGRHVLPDNFPEMPHNV